LPTHTHPATGAEPRHADDVVGGGELGGGALGGGVDPPDGGAIPGGSQPPL
jgi:hypothetical protein